MAVKQPITSRTERGGVGDVWTIILSLLLAFTLRELLVQVSQLKYGSVRELWLHIRVSEIDSYVLFGQFVVFVLLITRFFAGAFRFHTEASSLDRRPEFENKTFGGVFSLMMTFVLFSVFFIGANEIFSSDKIYFILFLMHVVDLIWFLFVIVYFKAIMNLSWSEPVLYPVPRFMALSIVTLILIATCVLYPDDDILLVLETRDDVKSIILVGLLIISICDFVWMWDFYVHPNKWRTRIKSRKKERVYIAGPNVFLQNQKEIGKTKREICEKYGFHGVFPTDGDPPEGDTPEDIAMAISVENERKMRGCDLIVANMTPFRGPSMDVGTAYEMGFMRGQGKRILGYSNDTREYFSRVKEYCENNIKERNGSGEYEDSNGMLIENFGLRDNLMLNGAIKSSNSRIEAYAADKNEIYSSLDAFECCVAKAASTVKK